MNWNDYVNHKLNALYGAVEHILFVLLLLGLVPVFVLAGVWLLGPSSPVRPVRRRWQARQPRFITRPGQPSATRKAGSS